MYWVHWLTDLFESHKRRVYTPTVIQMEVTECGAACLAIILGYYQRHIPLEELRVLCGVSRDGSTAYNVMEAAKTQGMAATAYSLTAEELDQIHLPAILYWEDSHFLVLESIYMGECAYLNDPGAGPYQLPWDKFKKKFKDIALELVPTPEFEAKELTIPFWRQLYERLAPFKRVVAFIVAVTAIFTLLGLFQPIFARIFIDNILSQKMWDWIRPLLGGFASLFILLFFFTYVRTKVMLRLSLKLSLVSSASFLKHMLKLPIAFFYQRFGGEVVTRIGLNNQIYAVLTGQAGVAILNILFVFFYAFVMFKYDMLITLIAIFVGILNLFILIFINESRQRAYAVLQMEQGKLTGKAIDFISNMEAIKLVGAKSFVFNRLIGLQTNQMNAWQRIGSKDIWLLFLTGMMQEVASLSLTLIGAWKVMFGGMSIGILVGMQFLLSRFLGPMGDLVSFGSTLQSQKINLARVNDVMKNKIDPVFFHQKNDACLADQKIPPALELKHITFGYSPLDEPLLNDLSINIASNQVVAIVGRTGSGKSTIAHLAAGLFAPWRGEVLYGGKPLIDYTAEQVSRSIAIVTQDFFLFEGTVFDNLTFWNPAISESQVLQALDDACILEEVLALKNGVHAHLIEGGANVSKGQQQRLEIARALLWNPSILILDEATSALDLEVEREFFNKLRRQNRATLIVTHRLSAIHHCHEVIVMENGEPIERGTSEALIARDGVFAQIVKAQGFA